MFDQPVKEVMLRKNVLKASPDALVSKISQQMARRNVGAVMVIEGDRLVGIFTERDVVFRVVAKGRDATTTHLADVMTRDPQTVAPDKPFGLALLRMHEGGFRHMPVVSNGKVVGIVSARTAMDPSLEEFVTEAQRREHYRARI
jgi:CBS domain-containing protein